MHPGSFSFDTSVPTQGDIVFAGKPQRAIFGSLGVGASEVLGVGVLFRVEFGV